MLILKRLKPLVPAVLSAALALTTFGIAGCSESSDGGTETTTTQPDAAAIVAEAESALASAGNAAEATVERVANNVTDTVKDLGSDLASNKSATTKPIDTGKIDLSASAAGAVKQPRVNVSTMTEPDPNIAGTGTGVVAEPKKLNLGQIPTNDAKSGFVKLVNQGDTPRTVLECKTSCGCTTANCQKGTVLEPGASMEVEIKLSGGARTTKLNKTVTFVVSDQPPLQVPISGEAVSFVEIEPATIDPVQHPDGRLVLRAIDDEPFVIKSMYPPVIEEFSTEPKRIQEVFLSWDKWNEMAPRSTKLLFHLDHPNCLKTYGAVSAAAVQGTKSGPGAQPPAVVQPGPKGVIEQLDQMLTDKKTDDVLTLIDDGKLDVNEVDSAGQTPLIKASRWGNPDVIQALLDESADISAGDRIGRTPLMYAAQSKNVEAVQVLLDAGANVNDRDSIGNTPLCWGAGFGDAASVRELLDAGAQVEVSGALTGFTPLIWAAGFGEAETVQMLIDAGANIEATDVMQGSTPIMNAARTGGPDNVRVLLEAGADLEAQDKDGKTTLLIAASNAGADAEMLRLLIESGADVKAKTNSGDDVLALAKKRTDLRAEAVLAALKELLPQE